MEEIIKLTGELELDSGAFGQFASILIVDADGNKIDFIAFLRFYVANDKDDLVIRFCISKTPFNNVNAPGQFVKTISGYTSVSFEAYKLGNKTEYTTEINIGGINYFDFLADNCGKYIWLEIISGS